MADKNERDTLLQLAKCTPYTTSKTTTAEYNGWPKVYHNNGSCAGSSLVHGLLSCE